MTLDELLSNSARARMYERLQEGPAFSNELAEVAGINVVTISSRMQPFIRAGLVEKTMITVDPRQYRGTPNRAVWALVEDSE